MNTTRETPWSFGDLVLSDAPGSRPVVGILAELRRADCRVLYLDTGSSVWAPLQSLRRVPEDRAAGTLEALVARLLALLGAAELEFTAPSPGLFRLIVSHGALTPEVIEQVRAAVGPGLRHHLIRPQGMHRIQTILDFVHP
jgi:hypothetical protein